MIRPQVHTKPDVTLDEALELAATVREYIDEHLTCAEIAKMIHRSESEICYILENWA